MQAQQWRVVVKHKIALSPFDELDLGLNLEFLCDYHDIEVLEKRKPISGSLLQSTRNRNRNRV